MSTSHVQTRSKFSECYYLKQNQFCPLPYLKTYLPNLSLSLFHPHYITSLSHQISLYFPTRGHQCFILCNIYLTETGLKGKPGNKDSRAQAAELGAYSNLPQSLRAFRSSFSIWDHFQGQIYKGF